jgi:hypothetical protein
MEHYKLQGDLWSAVLPPDVMRGYSSGFICLRCALESIDRPLCREDITDGSAEAGPRVSDGDFEFEIRFPKRDAKRRIHAIHLLPHCEDVDEPVGNIIAKFGWLLDRLAIQAKRVIVRQEYYEGRAVRINTHSTANRPRAAHLKPGYFYPHFLRDFSCQLVALTRPSNYANPPALASPESTAQS